MKQRKINRAVVEALSDAGFIMVRSGYHCIFKRPSDGASITVAITPRSGYEHQLAWVLQDIRRCNRKTDSERNN